MTDRERVLAGGDCCCVQKSAKCGIGEPDADGDVADGEDLHDRRRAVVSERDRVPEDEEAVPRDAEERENNVRGGEPAPVDAQDAGEFVDMQTARDGEDGNRARRWTRGGWWRWQ